MTKPRTRGGELSPGISNSVCSYPHLFDGSLSQFSNILALLSSFCWTKYSLMPYFSLVCDCSLKTCKSNQYSCLEHPMGKGAWQLCSPWDHKELDITERLHFLSQAIPPTRCLKSNKLTIFHPKPYLPCFCLSERHYFLPSCPNWRPRMLLILFLSLTSIPSPRATNISNPSSFYQTPITAYYISVMLSCFSCVQLFVTQWTVAH